MLPARNDSAIFPRRRVARRARAHAFTVALALSVMAGFTGLGRAAQESDVLVLPPERMLDRTGAMPLSPALTHSLVTASDRLARRLPPESAGAWTVRSNEVSNAFARSLGLLPLPERTDLHAVVLRRHEIGGLILENIRFESRPGFTVTANVYRPNDGFTGRRPAVLSPIGHFLSAGKANRDIQARCMGLAARGFVVLAYDAIGQGERLQPGNIHHEAGYALLPLGETIAGWMVWDSMRALDYLESRDDVDPARLGMTGNSGGGLNTLFTAALDRRVRAPVVVGFTFEFRHWLRYGGSHCTCTHLPGIFASLEWFEIAGLIAPRPLQLIQGDEDWIFPVGGARHAARDTARIYSLLDAPTRFRFTELARQPHAYTLPFREQLYAWMSDELHPDALPKVAPDFEPSTLPETDPRLRCFPEAQHALHSGTVVDNARLQGLQRLAAWDTQSTEPSPASVTAWAESQVAPPESLPHGLAPRVAAGGQRLGARFEKISFATEDGLVLPALLWIPSTTSAPPPVVLIAHSRGKGAVLDSDLVPALLQTGRAVMALDLRGRGETLGVLRQGYDTNFRHVANQVLLGEALAGRRGYDLRRAADLLARRTDLDASQLDLVGLEDDALPAMLASAADPRFRHLVIGRGVHSVLQHMKIMPVQPPEEMGNHWNDPQLDGRLRDAEGEVDLGNVIPGMLSVADVPELLSASRARRILFCDARARSAQDAPLAKRFARVTGARLGERLTDRAETRMTGAMLASWIAGAPPQ